jgi:transcriptional regulatory protein RtcR
VIDLNLSTYDLIAKRFAKEWRDELSLLKDDIDTKNEKYESIIQEIRAAALYSNEPILLTGPTGSGKSSIARRIHEVKSSKNRVSETFVPVNCSTLRGDTAMSALFGHVKGAYTGASKDRDGFLKMADGGTLFLDELGELGLKEQAMLLHAVEEKVFWPLGAEQMTGSDFHLITGTNRDLRVEVKAGRFRKDLYERIKLWTFELPALKDRPEDIEPNLDREIEKFRALDGTRISINDEAKKAFLEFARSAEATWEGNFRDLKAAVIRMGIFSDQGRVTVPVVSREVNRLREEWAEVTESGSYPLTELALGTEGASGIDHFDKPQLEEVLRVCLLSRNRSDAGKKLYNVSRGRKKSTNDADRLNKYLEKFGLDWDGVKALSQRTEGR